MDPFEPVRNEESSGYSKRRTSILKISRKSRSAEVEQQENVVECAKTSDKRISRRVSFAPANDVLLFAKEAKNPSPLKSPLQLLSAGDATQNRVQMKVNDDQQFTGIDKAPKQILQQKDVASIYSERNYGEKTMIFPTDDMDMTQCHTVRITNDEDFLDTSHGLLQGHGDKTVMFDRSMDMTLSQTLNIICDQDLSFSSKPTTPRAFPFTSQMTPGAHFFPYDNTDKENYQQKLKKSINKKMGETNVSFKDEMDMPEDDPLQCLFPQEIFAKPEKLKSETTSTDRKLTSKPTENDSKRRFTVNLNSKDYVGNEKTIVFSDGGLMDITQSYTSNIVATPSASSTLDTTGLKERKSVTTGSSGLASEGQNETLQCRFPLQERALHKDSKLHQKTSYKGLEMTLKTLNMPRHQIMIGSEEEIQEKTVRFSTDDGCMDMTRSHTVRISSDLHLQGELKSLPPGGEKPLPGQSVDLEFENFFASLSGQNPNEKTQKNVSMNDSKITRAPFEREEVCTGADDSVNMDITEAHTGRIFGDENLYHNVVQTGNNPQQQRTVLGTLPIKETESSHKSQIQRHPVNFNSKDDVGNEKTIVFSDGGLMDITQSYSSNIVAAPSTSSTLDMTSLKERKSITTGPSGLASEGHNETLQCRFPLQERALHKDSKLQKLQKPSYKGMEMTSKTLNMPRHQIMIGSEEEIQEKTVRFSTDDVCMDMTRSHTVRISSDLHLQGELESLPAGGEKTVRFSTHDAGMDMTQCLTVNLATDLLPNSPARPKQEAVMSLSGQSVDLEFENFFASLSGQNPNEKTQKNVSMNDSKITRAPTRNNPQQQRTVLGTLPIKGTESSHKSQIQRHLVPFDAEEPCRERTVRFAADEALMDMTSCHTVHISTDFKPDLPCSEKTIRFDVDDAAMDITQCHTVNIAKDFDPSLHHDDLGLLPKYGEKTVRFNTDDATMDMTRSQTVNIGFEQIEGFNSLPKYGEKTERINAAMDETRCLTVNLVTEMRPKPCLSLTQVCAADPEPRANQNSYPTSGEKTLRFSVDDANMEVTKSHTMVMDVAQSEEKTEETEASCSALSPVPSSMDVPPALKKREPSIYSNRRCKSLSRQGLNAALNARRSVPWINPLTQATPTPGTDDEDFVKLTKTGAQNGNIGILSMIEEKSIAEVSLKEKCLDNSTDKNMTEALPVQIQSNSIVESPLKDLAPCAEEQTTEDPLSKCELEIKIHPGSPQRNMKNDFEQEVVGKSECSPTFVEKDREAVCSRKSRRMSLADLQSKIKRISQKINAPTGDDLVDDINIPTPLPDLEPKLEADKPNLLPSDEPAVDLEKNENKSDALDEPFCAPTTPFKLETKRLMSRLSVVGFKPKLTKRSKSEEIKTLDGSDIQAAGEPTKTQNIQAQNQTGNFDLNVSDINAEELGSYEEVSESLDKGSEMVTSYHEFELDHELQDEVFEEEFALVNEKKRPPDEEYIKEDEKRLKRSNDTMIIMDSQTCALECDDNITTAANTQTTNSDCSHTANLKYDSTFESTSKQSLYESQLEDYANDIQRKYDEGTLTMMEFFKLFHIDFVIHNSRQSVAPGRVTSDAESTLLDLSHDRHISLPKQLVYEADVHNLTDQVEGLKVRMRDLEKPLTLVNRTLWEEMEQFSEAEFKSFGAKLKERHNFYRKMSKAKSHEMKEVLYAHLIQANVEEQKKLSGSIEKADAMLKSLDDCIADLKADLATIESDVKSHQEELNNVKEATSNNERSLSELEIQKKQNLNKLRRVKDETKNLDRHLTMLHTINEWKLVKTTTSNAIYTFLYGTLHLELVFEKTEGSEDRKIVDISFEHLLDERSECHARLVHTLVSQFTQDKSYTQKYSTSKHVPELLHDISLVVSRCRELGEELRILKAWGSLRFDILDIHCLDSEIYITFSSLGRFRKFEVVFSVGLTNQQCALELKSFKNIIGDTTSQNVEEIFASFTPGHKYLTGIIKTIHSTLLC